MTALERSGPCSATLHIAGAVGGQGATTVATVIAALAARHRTVAMAAVRPADVCALAGLPLAPEDGRTAVELAPGLTLDASDDHGAFHADSDSAVGSVRTLGLTARPTETRGAASFHRLRVVDCGRADQAPAGSDGASAATRWLVVRGPCYLALRAALRTHWRADGVVLLAEAGRALRAADVADVLGLPVLAEVPVDSRLARAVDAGVLLAQVDQMAALRPLDALVRRSWPVDLGASA
jgi:hypothetical protein